MINPQVDAIKPTASGSSVLFPGVTMATKGKRKRSPLCLAVILFFVSHFARTAESFRLTKTERSPAAAEFQPGRIVFGNVFDEKSRVEARVGDGAHLSPSSPEGDANYQGDYPGSDRSFMLYSTRTWLIQRHLSCSPPNPNSP